MNQEIIEQPKKQTLPRNIILLGLVSMFIDMSTEMVYPIMPMFLLALGTAPSIIGIIEGISESIASVLKVFAGYVSDKTGKKKLLTIAGYGAAFIYKICIYFSTGWGGVLAGKIIDRTGKGLRTAPRDSIIAESGGKKLGASYGLHKMFDMLGSALGVLLAFVLVYFAIDFREVFLWSLIPAAIGVGILFFVKETKNTLSATREKFKIKELFAHKKLILYILAVFIFSIGNSSNAFLLLKAQANGFDATTVLLVYLAFNVASSTLSIPFGKLSDKIGRKSIIVAAYCLYGAVYFGFAYLTGMASMIILFVIYGVYSALISGTEKALVVELSPKHLKGTVLGLQGMAQGIGLFISSTLAGVVWEYVGDSTPFIIGGSLAFASAIAMLFILNMKNAPKNDASASI